MTSHSVALRKTRHQAYNGIKYFSASLVLYAARCIKSSPQHFKEAVDSKLGYPQYANKQKIWKVLHRLKILLYNF